MNFQTYTSGGVTYTADQQAAAWDAYIKQDKYLRTRRGQYAERGATFLPMLSRADLAFSQDLSKLIGRVNNSLQLRVDILNVGNLLSKDWGVGQRAVSTSPLLSQGADAQGRALYRLRAFNNKLMDTTFEPTSGFGDVYQVQFGVRYTFN